MISVHRSRAVLVAAVAAVATTLAGCSTPPDDDASEIVRTTTRIAGASVVGIDRDTSTACALPSPLDPGQPANGTRTVLHTAGRSDVPVDPQRIVVLDTAALDAVCALGLWERVVGASAEVSGRPEYLGTGIGELPAVGAAGAPDVAAIERARPDVILGSSTDPDAYTSLNAVAPTVLVGSDPVFWREQFLRVGEALGRTDAARRVLDDYTTAARELGRELASPQTQASIVRFTPDGPTVEGTASFAGQVLGDLGAARPPAQRFAVVEGRPWQPVDTADPAAADGDVIFVRFAGEEGLERGTEYMRTDEWLDLGAVRDNRLFSVSDDVWSTPGPVAARAILTDLTHTLNGYSS
ncbi:ABC transporter substrate-binding protein [Rhodococcus sp. CH91]|uniref:ABC transporter substrate-binding protein n=1 Tax=Rhodococcus sp. CH91 TaxID=2910256 RepID=UPI001F4AC86F|nr:ABC transporter substrate-binding protein [Rhodococcus sp. CH91]